jgi:outer membrane protein TolC
MRRILLLPFVSLSLMAQERLGLPQAIAAALAARPRLKAMEAQGQAAEARQEQARWDRLGRFETAFQLTPFQRPIRVGESIEFRTTERYSLTAEFNQTLWDWGATRNRHEAARMEAEASRQALVRTRQQVVFEATQGYALASLAGGAWEVAREHTLQQRAFMRTAMARVEAGTAARLDGLKAELALAQAESAEGEARNRAQQAREALADITSEPRFLTCGLGPMEDGVETAEAEPSTANLALAHRPDRNALLLQSSALGFSAGAARSARLPSLSLRSSVTQQHEDGLRLFHRESQSYQVGLALAWDPTAGARSRARAAELEALQRSVQEQLRGAESAAALEVRQAQANLQEARARIRVQRQARQVAEEQARIARIAYREGTVTAIEAQDAEQALLGARHGEWKAVTDAVLARAALTLALGQ